MRMRPLFVFMALAGGVAMGDVSAKAPVGATGECKDGTYTKANSKEGACSSHGGVKDWFDAKAAPAARPNDATGLCDDGTYTTAASKSGACSGHKGVKDWYGADSKAKPAPEPAKGKSPVSEPDARTAPRNTPPAPSTSSDRPTQAQPSPRPGMAAAGGGAGKVWVNTNTKVYHCEKDKLYGKTKKGNYMTEAEAKSSGARAARGKECS